jgi:hypothetical protein
MSGLGTMTRGLSATMNVHRVSDPGSALRGNLTAVRTAASFPLPASFPAAVQMLPCERAAQGAPSISNHRARERSIPSPPHTHTLAVITSPVEHSYSPLQTAYTLCLHSYKRTHRHLTIHLCYTHSPCTPPHTFTLMCITNLLVHKAPWGESVAQPKPTGTLQAEEAKPMFSQAKGSARPVVWARSRG